MNALDREWGNCVETTEVLSLNTGPIYRHIPTGLYVRNRGDVGVILEQKRDYGDISKFEYPRASLFLDLGGHIGDSVSFFLKEGRGLGRAVTVEADPRNVEILRMNWGLDPRVAIIDMAVVEDTPPIHVDLYLGKTYSGDNSLEPYRGRNRVRVLAARFYDLLFCKPSVIKCDIEGSEFLLDWNKVPESVTEIFMEMHQNRPEWIEKGRGLDNTLLGLGFKHHKAPQHKPLFLKRQIAIWTRR